MIGRILLATAIFTATLSAQAAWDVGAGLENYQWEEYPDPPSGNPKESGLRSALLVNWTQEGDRGLLLAWRAKLYGGTVNYDTFYISTGAAAPPTKTDYFGVASEPQLFYRYNLGTYRLDQLAGLGLDYWRRHIRSGVEQIEDYSIPFLRAGLRFSKSEREAGVHGEFGLKFPFLTNEDAHLTSTYSPHGFLYTSNPNISPKGAVSGYAEIGYRINPRFDVLGYYDSWRFKRSDDVRAADTSGAVWLIHQPKSYMDAVGVKLLVSF